MEDTVNLSARIVTKIRVEMAGFVMTTGKHLNVAVYRNLRVSSFQEFRPVHLVITVNNTVHESVDYTLCVSVGNGISRLFCGGCGGVQGTAEIRSVVSINRIIKILVNNA